MINSPSVFKPWLMRHHHVTKPHHIAKEHIRSPPMGRIRHWQPVKGHPRGRNCEAQ